MKIVITYAAEDIARVIRQDLARQGIIATDADIKYTKGSVIVACEATVDDPPVAAEPVAPAAPPPRPVAAPAASAPAPVLAVVEGGANPVDMSAVLRDSKRIATTTEGKFPVPKHNMIEGESTEWPGTKE